MLMILARLVRSESFWAVAKVRSPHAGPGIRYIIELHRTIQLRSPGLNALSLRRYQTARILHASLHRWLD